MLLISVCLALGVWLTLELLKNREISTDNAYIQADQTTISTKVAGYVTRVYVQDNQHVKAGDILFKIDNREYLAKQAQAEANVQSQEAALADIEANIELQQSIIQQSQAQFKSKVAVQHRANLEHQRQALLKKEEATTTQQLEESISMKAQAQAAATESNLNINVQRKKVDILMAQKSAAQARLKNSLAALELAKLDVENTQIKAPFEGVIANRKVVQGKYVSVGNNVLTLVPLQNTWVQANFKETELANIKPGQIVTIQVDAYPDTKLQGTVDSFSPGSGSAFSLLPPDNASGNFVRVVQRVPVKIKITQNPLKERLVPGLSAQVSISTNR